MPLQPFYSLSSFNFPIFMFKVICMTHLKLIGGLCFHLDLPRQVIISYEEQLVFALCHLELLRVSSSFLKIYELTLAGRLQIPSSKSDRFNLL